MERLTALFRQIDLSQLLLSVAIIIVTVVLWRLFRRAFRSYAARRAEDGNARGRTETTVSVVYGVVKGLVIIGVVLVVLQVNGVNVSAMVAGLGIASAIVGLAFQDLLRDIIMGLHIVSDDFFEVGDVIQYGAVEGQVVSYNIRTTKIRDIADGNIMTICNRNITEIVKRSGLLLMNVPLSYEEDYRRVHRVLSLVCERIAEVDGVEKCEYKGTQDFADSAVLYRIHIYAPPEKKWEVWRAARTLVQEGLAQAGIQIPYQQLDIHTYPGRTAGSDAEDTLD